MNEIVKKEPIDSSKYNEEYSDKFDRKYPIVFVEFANPIKYWIVKHKIILDVIKKLLSYDDQQTNEFKEKLLDIIQTPKIQLNLRGEKFI
jgi:hypothetical protein